MLSSGSIPHLRAHPRFRLRQRGADRSRLYPEVPSDLAVIQSEIELRDDHGTLPLAQSGEEAAYFHPIERCFDLVLRYPRSGVTEMQQRPPQAAPTGPDRNDEEPASEVIVFGRWFSESGDEGVLQGVESAVRIAENGKERPVHARELLPVEQFPALGRDRRRHY
jgi:hypothetical protein